MKTALCIGINNYPGQNNDLKGCVNDMNDWKTQLERVGFTVKTLQDQEATNVAIQQEIDRVVQSANNGDTVYITFSGHGSWIPDRSDDESDGRDEVICPYDIENPLADDTLDSLFRKKKPGVKLVFISDSCHSGTVSKAAVNPEEVQNHPRIRFLPPSEFLREPAVVDRAKKIGLKEIVHTAVNFIGTALRSDGALLMGGCKDTELSYDATFNGRPNGAFTYYAIQEMKRLSSDDTYNSWYRKVRNHLPSTSYQQTPQLYGGLVQKNWKVLA